MSVVRAHIQQLSDQELQIIFEEGENFEKTFSVPDDAFLRKIASQHIEDNVMAMTFVLHEVWREMVIRNLGRDS